jgi:hypothetical protein
MVSHGDMMGLCGSMQTALHYPAVVQQPDTSVTCRLSFLMKSRNILLLC